MAGGDSVGAGDGNCTTDEGDYGVGIYGGFFGLIVYVRGLGGKNSWVS